MPTNKKSLSKILGTSVINSPLSPPSRIKNMYLANMISELSSLGNCQQVGELFPAAGAALVLKHVVEEGVDTVVDTAEHPEHLLHAEVELEEGVLVDVVPEK